MLSGLKAGWILVVSSILALSANVAGGGDPLDAWVTNTLSGSGDNPSRVGYGLGQFVATSSYYVYSSPDGTRWTNRGQIYGFIIGPAPAVVAGPGLFLLLGPDWDTYRSYDGAVWTHYPITAPCLPDLNGGTFAEGMFVAVGGSGIGEVQTTATGDSWTTLYLPDPESLFAVVHGHGQYIAVGRLSGSGYNATVSLDTIGWTKVRLGMSQFLRSITYGQGKFVAAEAVGNLLWSRDGVSWTNMTVGAGTDFLRSVCYGNGTFVGCGSGGLWTSPDAVAWTKRPVGTTNALFEVTFGQGKFVVLGNTISFTSDVLPPVTARVRFATSLCGRLANGTMWLTVEAPYGRPVTVEASEDFSNWTPIATDACERGEFEVYDEAVNTTNHRFYRAWQTPH